MTMFQEKLDSSVKKCKSCGGNMIFSPQFQSLYCEKCGGQEKFDFIQDYSKHAYLPNKNQKDKNNLSKDKIFKCSSCGANVVLSTGDMANVCPYCNSSFVVENSEIKGLKPDFVIPFAFDRSRASDMFKAGIKRKWFLPNKFKKAPPIDQISGIYFPVFSFDEHTESSYNGVLEKDETVRNGEHTTTIVKSIRISGHKSLNHTNILTETSNHLNQSVFNQILPYNIGGAYKYNENFIRGYAVEYYTDPLDLCKKQADLIIDDIVRSHILSGYRYDRVRYLNVSTVRSDEKFAYGIMPAYRFNYNYNGKDYETLINGQTGKVGGGLPKSKVKITFFVLAILLILIGIGVLIFLSETGALGN